MDNELLNTYLGDLIEKYNYEIIEIQRLTNYTITDEQIAIAVDKAYKSIIKYTGWSEFDINYHSALLTLAINYLNNDKLLYNSANGDRTVKSVTQGARSTTYESASMNFDSNGLTQDVKAMLPLPKLRCV